MVIRFMGFAGTIFDKSLHSAGDGKLIALANGFHKKSQRTPKIKIIKALKIMEEYKNEK